VMDQASGEATVDPATLKNITYRGAIKLYEDALKASSGGRQDVPVLYQLSKAYEQAGQQDKALQALNRLLAIAPEADNRDELQFRRGEIFFDRHRFKQAEQAYAQTVLVGPSSSYYQKALSKHGWSAYKQGKYEVALGSFLALLDIKLRTRDGQIDQEGEHLSRGDKELVNDLFRVVILSFDELGGASAVSRYFAGHDHRQYELRIYRELGDFYLAKGRVRDAAESYAAFSKAYPMHEQAFEFDLKAIDAYKSAGFANLMIGAKKAFVHRYRINGPYWKRHEEKEYTLLARLRVALRANSEDVARYLHAQAQKSKSSLDYQRAFLWYKQHLKWFGKSDNAQKLNFLYAELLFEAGDYEAAAKEYDKTAYQYVRGGRDAEAGYAALLSYTEQEKRVTGKKKEVWSRLAVGSALRFGKTFPNDPRAAKVLTKAAEDMFALKRYTQASVAARQILELSSEMTADMRRTAWMIIARAEFEKGDYTRAEVAYKVALSLTPESNENYKVLKEGLAAAVYKQGEFMRSKGNTQAAIAQFERAADVAPDSSITVAAEYDVAASMMSAGDWAGAIEKFVDFRLANPKHALVPQVTQNLIKAYLATNQSEQAAHELERLVKLKQDPEVRRSALWQAAELYAKAGNREEEIRVYKYYLQLFPAPLDQAMEARQKLVDIYAKAGQDDDPGLLPARQAGQAAEGKPQGEETAPEDRGGCLHPGGGLRRRRSDHRLGVLAGGNLWRVRPRSAGLRTACGPVGGGAGAI
jgi:tetratricopeptide (TPR) repeat protein